MSLIGGDKTRITTRYVVNAKRGAKTNEMELIWITTRSSVILPI